jgi:hypothetical protein
MLPQQFLRPPDAAAFLRKRFGFGAVRSLAKLRVVGKGPAFRKAGRLILYAEDDLVAWANGKLTGPHRSTSDTGGQGPVGRRKRGRPRKAIEPSAPSPAE